MDTQHHLWGSEEHVWPSAATAGRPGGSHSPAAYLTACAAQDKAHLQTIDGPLHALELSHKDT